MCHGHKHLRPGHAKQGVQRRDRAADVVARQLYRYRYRCICICNYDDDVGELLLIALGDIDDDADGTAL